MPTEIEAQGRHPGHSPWAVALAVTVATFMEVMDISIANVALPHIAGGLSAGVDESTWILTSYLVSNAIILPISAWLKIGFMHESIAQCCWAAHCYGYSTILDSRNGCWESAVVRLRLGLCFWPNWR
ncbi:MAG TPA: hypothetical protein VH325_11180 [Bryobacteraceae bacterium]|nr:hypothetical protein [Bryobacteraceae bacterium]